ncbi:MAG: sulfite reductase subunit gamma [Betaproteobacteria bacterium RBG_16_56_24]|nr:MAG: sulfite reductase subunit gamma [Betaproteobacteria bacterium RBG_16_56_24]
MQDIAQLPETDGEGYLIDPHDWNEDIARRFAAGENISLTEDHWDALRFMRDYYADQQIAPDVRHVMKHLAERLGPGSRNRIFELFPYGYVKQACKIAGMKRPRGWSTG